MIILHLPKSHLPFGDYPVGFATGSGVLTHGKRTENANDEDATIAMTPTCNNMRGESNQIDSGM